MLTRKMFIDRHATGGAIEGHKERSVMSYILIALSLPLLFLGLLAGRSYAGVDAGISIEDGKVKGFYLAVRDYYKVPEKEIRVVRERRIPDEEMPVVFFLAKKASVPPSKIMELRLQGMSWMEITYHYGLSPDIFYVPVRREVSGPPYGNAYGHFKHGHKHGRGGPHRDREESRAEFSDADVVNLVNLKFVSEHYKMQPEEVIDMRSNGKNFISINAEIKNGRKDVVLKGGSDETKERYDENKDYDGEGKGRGRGRGRGHDKRD